MDGLTKKLPNRNECAAENEVGIDLTLQQIFNAVHPAFTAQPNEPNGPGPTAFASCPRGQARVLYTGMPDWVACHEDLSHRFRALVSTWKGRSTLNMLSAALSRLM